MKQNRYILLVQRDPSQREATRSLLEQAGHHVTSAADGVAALALAAKAARPYDAAVIDLSLPGLSGLEVAHRIRATPGGAGAPLVCVAPGDLEGRQRAAFERWFTACVAEPVARTRLLETLARVMDGRETHPHAV